MSTDITSDLGHLSRMDVFLPEPSTTDQNNSELERRQVCPENKPLTII